ncbi:MAG: tetratricopeptide repeat protein [Oryzomonas sp.]
MVKLLISIAVITACIAPRPSWGEAPGDTADTPDAIRRQLDAVSDAREKALLHKRLGDIFAERDDYSLAAGEYEAALSTPRGFSPEERLQMVERLSWAGKLGSAEKYARELLADKPDYFDARVTLARVLSWQEHLDDAIAEADLVLKVEHHHRGALLVKADSLRWKGNNHDAAAIYRALLAEQEEFGPRLGLAYTRISAGDLNGARESLRMLKPRFPYQERDMKALEGAVKEAAEAATAHRLSLRTSFYSDTDNNDVNRYGALYTYQMAPGTEMGAEYLHTYARDPTRAVNMDSLNIQGTATTGGGYVFGATAGLHQIDAPTDRHRPDYRERHPGACSARLSLSAAL